MASEAEKQQREANRLYWQTDLPVREIAERMQVSRSTFYRQLTADPAGERCPECATPLVYANRSAREAGEAECPECGLERDIPARETAGNAAGAEEDRSVAGEEDSPRIPPGTARPARGYRTAPGAGDRLQRAGERPAGGARSASESAQGPAGEARRESGPPRGMDTRDALRRARSVLLGGAVIAGVAGVLIAKLIARRR